MKPDIICEIENRTGKKLTRLSGMETLADGVRNQYNKSYVLEDGELVLLNVCGTDSLEELVFNARECAALQYLNLSENKNLTRVRWDGPLPDLRYLDLSECRLAGLTLPDGCHGLKKAWLQKNGLKTCEFQGPCPRLQLLDLSENALHELTLPFGFASLAYLYLVETGLRSLVFEPGQNETAGIELRFQSPLPQLQTLHLRGNKLKAVPGDIIFSSSLTALYLAGNAPGNIPKVFLGSNSPFAAYNCLQDARIWFEELRDHPGEKNRAVKLMLTGNGNVGKSTLACAMENGRCVHDHGSTHGIIIEPLDRREITCNIWDFGGQEVYHGTHRLFIESEALQVIVFDAGTEEHARTFTPEQDRIRNDQQVLPHPLECWYETAEKLSPDSVYFFVQNKKQENEPEDRNIRNYAEGRARFVPLNAKTGEDVDDFLYFLQKDAGKLPDFGMTMPRSWLRVRQFFIDNLEAEQNTKIISKGDFVQLCETHGVMEKARPLLFRYLHHNGYLYHHENLGDNIIADQRWALAAIYKPYDRRAAHYQEFFDLEGKIRVRRLFEVFGDGYSEDEKWLFLEFMAGCGLCFQLNHRPGLEGKRQSDIYVFPEFLPPAAYKRIMTFWKQGAEDVYVLRYRLAWLNYFVIQSFITALGRKTETDRIWRYGIDVALPGDEGSFMVELDYEQKALLVHIEQSAMAGWLKDILEALDLDHGREGWEISGDGRDYTPFDPDKWRVPDQRKRMAPRTETADRHTQRRIPEKLPDQRQRLARPVILFFIANPTAESVSYGLEYTYISAKLAEETLPGRFELVPVYGTSADKMIDDIDAFQPTIVHFCGHGREVNDLTRKGGGLVLHRYDSQGTKELDAERLSAIFNDLKERNPNLQLVFLNACYSGPQAQAISRHGLYCIGADDELASPAARTFAAGFYREYARTRDVKEATRRAYTHGLTEEPAIKNLFHLFHNGDKVGL